SCTIAIHQPAEASSAAAAIASCATRRPTFGGPATKYTTPNTGTTSNACSSFVKKPKPTHEKANTSHQVDPRSSARVTPYAPATSSSTSNASGLLKRNISVAIGVSAITAPASNAAGAPNQRFTDAYNNAT